MLNKWGQSFELHPSFITCNKYFVTKNIVTNFLLQFCNKKYILSNLVTFKLENLLSFDYHRFSNKTVIQRMLTKRGYEAAYWFKMTLSSK
jgi:hypothetical protein